MGSPPTGQLLIDRPGEGACLVDLSAVALRPIDLPGFLNLQEVQCNLGDVPISIPEVQASIFRKRSQYLGRIALAFDMLGASESALNLAVEHARNREQFGLPIGRFQAVRHLLAWARVDCAALSAVVYQAVEMDDLLPPEYDEVVKALAGRNARRVCQRTLQVLGAIGFTTEHRHHHYYSRVLGLDSLLGSSAALTYDLASRCRISGLYPPHVNLRAALLAG